MHKMTIAVVMTAAAHMTLAGPAAAQEDEDLASLLDGLFEPEDVSAEPDDSGDDTMVASDDSLDDASAPAPDMAGDDAPVEMIPVAQDEAPQVKARPERSYAAIEEVVVTAQRREQSAQDVPISITVFSGKQLANANITNSADLALYTPSLSTNTRFGADNATFSIRGFTQELRTTPSVATYMAEVVAPRGQSSQTSGDGAGPGAMFDLANVQVLKGPQGTLFGRNTTGGAVLLVPNRPTDEFGGYLELSGGEWGSQRAQGVVNFPFSDEVKTRLAIDMNQRDGHLENFARIGANQLGSVDYLSGRFSLVWDLSDDIENYTILSYIDSDSTGYTSQLYACNPDTLNNGVFLLFAGLLDQQACEQQLQTQADAGKNGFYDIVSTIATPVTAIKEKRLINTFTWALSDETTFKGIFAYAHLHTKNGSDIFGTQFRYNLGGVPIDPNTDREFKIGVSVPNPDIPVTSQETYVAEVQLQGNYLGGALEWQGGFYYENSLPDGFSGNNSAGLLSCNMASLEGDPSGFDCYDPLLGAVGGVLVQYFKTEYLNRAVYSQTTWHINDQFSLTGGLRYTWDRSEGYGIKTRYGFALAVPMEPTEQVSTPHVSSQAPTGLIEFDYKPIAPTMIYAKYVRGYRQGNVILAADPGVDTFDPETVDSYELGLKTDFGGPVPGRFNFAVFYNDLTNQQLQLGYISATALQTTTIVNAGKSRIQGLEGDITLLPLDGLTINLSFSFLDTKLLEQEDQTERVGDNTDFLGRFSVTPIADVGDELPYAPKQTYIASVNWRLPTSSDVGDIDLGVTYSSIGEQRSAASSSGPYGMLSAFETLNMNVSWARIFNLPLDLVVFGTNLLNEEYVTYTSGTYNLLAFESRAVGTPRMIGARLKYNFGESAY